MIQQYVLDMLVPIFLSLPIIVIWRVVTALRTKAKGRKTTALHETGLVIFAMFLVGLAFQTILQSFVLKIMSGSYSNGVVSVRLNLVPFKVLFESYAALQAGNFNCSYFLINFIGNIIMFMPIGFMIPLLWDKMPVKKVLLIGFCISFFIEAVQLPLGRGTDIDDLWLNTLGVLLGALGYMLLRRVSLSFTKKFKLGAP